MAGKVNVNGNKVLKASEKYAFTDIISITGNDCPYVSRGGLKMARAIEYFDIDVSDMEFLDAGSSTGGFTDCLLQKGAARVWCVDVGYGQLDWKLRNDKRVAVFERTNIKDATLKLLGRQHPFDGAAADLSFIGLAKTAGYIAQMVRPGGILIFLIKPQFEAGKEHIEKGGVVKNTKTIISSVKDVCAVLLNLGISVMGTVPSNIKTPKGNRELLLYAVMDERGNNMTDFEKLAKDLFDGPGKNEGSCVRRNAKEDTIEDTSEDAEGDKA
jgi:23S rRNA (cytidine1920-2'-O)/16S rRNA (cytidine1409-2'-O)-methyltransferase